MILSVYSLIFISGFIEILSIRARRFLSVETRRKKHRLKHITVIIYPTYTEFPIFRLYNDTF